MKGCQTPGRSKFFRFTEDKALLWFLGTKIGSWLELKQNLIQMWCFVMTITNAIVEVAKVFQKENEHICFCMSKFEGYGRFFKGTLSKEAIIVMFLNNVRKSLRVHTISIKRTRPSWENFLKETTCIDNKEPREVVVVKAPFINSVLAESWKNQGS